MLNQLILEVIDLGEGPAPFVVAGETLGRFLVTMLQGLFIVAAALRESGVTLHAWSAEDRAQFRAAAQAAWQASKERSRCSTTRLAVTTCRSCSSNSRLLVHASLKDALLEKVRSNERVRTELAAIKKEARERAKNGMDKTDARIAYWLSESGEKGHMIRNLFHKDGERSPPVVD